MKIIFIADFFANQVLGGGELNNEELLEMLVIDGYDVIKINSHNLTSAHIEKYKNDCFIVANFVNIRKELIPKFYNKNYLIYEHDHKYMISRNPGVYPGFKAPPEHLVHIDFYKNARAVLCQSHFHLEIVKMNTDLKNLVNLSGNLWSLKSLALMRELSTKEKINKFSIMDSPIEHKNTREAIMYCVHTNKEYDLIKSSNYETFLEKLSNNKTFVFFPKTPETLSRVVVEARMMGMSVVVNKMIGATREEWYRLKGEELIDHMIEKRNTIKKIVLETMT